MSADSNVLTGALGLLRYAGIKISAGNLDCLFLLLPDGTRETVAVKSLAAPPTPSKLAMARQRSRVTMYFLPRLGEAVAEAALSGDIHVVALEPATVIVRGKVLLPPGPVNSLMQPKSGKRTKKASWGRWAVLRTLLLASQPMKQREIAETVGITQPAVSQSLKHLQPHAIRSSSGGWFIQERIGALESWLAEYPGPGGAATYWYGLDSPVKQAGIASRAASEAGAEPLISGDVAADTYAPWRLPAKSRLYMRELVDFTAAGFSPAGAEDATLIATVPADTTIWGTTDLRATDDKSPSLADPLITLWDLTHETGPDAIETANCLRSRILSE